MSVLKTVTLLANAMIHSGTGLIGFANDEPVVRVLAFAPQNLRLNKNEWNKQSKRGILFIFYNQLTERKDWDVFIACVYGPVYPPWVCPPGNDSFTVCVLYPSFSPPPLLPHISPFLYPAEKKTNKMKCTNDNYADVKECKPGAQMYEVMHLLNSSPWVGPRSLQTRWLAHFDTTTAVCDGDGGIPKQEVAAVDPHRWLLYRLTWTYPSPMRL